MSLSWRERLADYSLNTELAERWEKQFAYCTASDRAYQLQEPRKGLKVHLKDGGAFFHVESDPAYDQALAGLLELLAGLDANRPQRLRMQIKAEFLQPSQQEFETAMAKVNTRLVNDAFPARIGGEIVDVAYLADFMFDRTWVQINAGAIRANETTRRVSATIKEPPAVAYFYSIVGRPTDESEVSGRGAIALVEKLMDLGTFMAQEFAP